MSPSFCWDQRWFWAAWPFQLHIVPALPLKGWGFLWGRVPPSQRSWVRSVSLCPCQTLTQHPDCHIWPDGNPEEIWCSFGIKWNGMGELTQIHILYICILNHKSFNNSNNNKKNVLLNPRHSYLAAIVVVKEKGETSWDQTSCLANIFFCCAQKLLDKNLMYEIIMGCLNFILLLYIKYILYIISHILKNIPKVSYVALNWKVNVYGVSFNTNLKSVRVLNAYKTGKDMNVLTL